GNVKPITSTDIRMEAETVQVIAYDRYAEYRVDFKFVNRGKAQKVKLGFPFNKPPEGDYIPPAAFRAWQDGKPLTVTYAEVDDRIPGWEGWKRDYYLHEATFPHGTTMITVNYLAAPGSTVVGPPEGVAPPPKYADATYNWLAYYPYRVSTGSGWAGTIGTTVIRYSLSSDFLGWGPDEAMSFSSESFRETEPEGDGIQMGYAKPSPGVHQWTFTDYEPKAGESGNSPYDIEFAFWRPQTYDGPPPPWTPVVSVKSSTNLKLGEYAYPAAQAADGNPSSAWAEAAKGSGKGQWVLVKFGQVKAVKEIRVLPGYAKRPELFYKYNRPKRLKIEFSDGTATTITLADRPELQRFPADAEAVTAKVTILDVYRGTTRDETYLSEIEFGTVPAPEFAAFDDLIGGGEGAGNLGAVTPPGGQTTASANAAGGATGSKKRTLPCAPPGFLGLAALGLVLSAAGKRRRGSASDT
ncbi:MAG: hypothetical protein C0418_03360, partial [Coriobacteriaceae bacterium]|nr:hypothetical protein [Coriobacteriaceae bacterium]